MHGQAIVLGDEKGKPRASLVIIEDEIAFAGVGHCDQQVNSLIEKKIAPLGLGRNLNLRGDEGTGGQKAERAEGGQISHTGTDTRIAGLENKMEFTVLARIPGSNAQHLSA